MNGDCVTLLQDDVETDDETEGNDIPSESTCTSVSHRKQAANDNPAVIEGSRQKRDAIGNLKAVLTKATQALNTISETARDRNTSMTSNDSPRGHNAAWSFWNMMYHELMSVEEQHRSYVQFQLYNCLMQSKYSMNLSHATETEKQQPLPQPDVSSMMFAANDTLYQL